MFFGFVWLVTCIAGGILLGTMPFASTELTADITATSDTLNVESTEGLADPGIVVIGDERIAYSHLTDTTIEGNFARPLIRGSGGTEAVAHSEGDRVRMVEGSLINSSMDYNLAIIADAAGAQAFFSVPTAIWNIVMSFAVSPFAFLGTDLQIITVIWGIMFLGMAISLFLSIAGGRRV